jgi:hypothetical protein
MDASRTLVVALIIGWAIMMPICYSTLKREGWGVDINLPPERRDGVVEYRIAQQSTIYSQPTAIITIYSQLFTSISTYTVSRRAERGGSTLYMII